MEFSASTVGTLFNCSIAQVKWKKSHFETFKCGITEFSTDFIKFNANLGLSVTHKSVVGYWYQLIWSIYEDGNSTCNIGRVLGASLE